MRFLHVNSLEAVHSSRINVGKLRKGLKGILACQLWLQIYVSIVNKFIETVNDDFITYHFITYDFITYDVLLIFPRLFVRWYGMILYHLCYKNDLHELIKIHDRFEWTINNVQPYMKGSFTCACAKNNLDVCDWLVATFGESVKT